MASAFLDHTWTPEQIEVLKRRGLSVVVHDSRGDRDMTKHHDDEHTKTEEARRTQQFQAQQAQDSARLKAEKPQPKPTAQQTSAALHSALKAMVAEAELLGHRDAPSVVQARVALEMAEPEKPEETVKVVV